MPRHHDTASSSPRYLIKSAETPADSPATESTHDALLAMLATHTGQIVWVRDAAGLVTWEAGWSAYTGLTPGSAMGLRWLSAVHPEDVTSTVQAWDRALETGQPYEVQQRLRRADGEYRVFRSRAMPVLNEDGFVREWAGVSVDITEFAELAAQADEAIARERTAWEQRNDAHRRLLATLESISDGFFSLDRDWRIIYMNATAANAIGATPQDFMGRIIWEKSPDLVGTEFERIYRQAMADQEPAAFEAYFASRDSWFDVDAYPSPTGLAVYYRDVTAAKRREDEIRQSKEDTRAFLTNAPIAIARVDTEGHIDRANPALCALVDYSVEDLVGRDFADLQLPDDATVHAAAGAEPGTLGTQDRRLLRKDGSLVHVRVTATLLSDADGHTRGTAYALEDITELRRLRQALAEADASRDKLGAAGASAEIATPDRPVESASSACDAHTPLAEEELSHCPACGRELIDAFFVSPAGELVGCPDCADQRELAGVTLSRDEWLGSTHVLSEVLARFGLPTGTQASKPTLTPARRPNAYCWDVLTLDGARYQLRRFSGWYPDTAVAFQHSLLAEVAATGLPVPRVQPARDGGETVEVNGMRWALYRALEGHITAESEWQWLRPKAAELLGQLHVALEHASPKGAPFALWGAWDADTLDRVLASWPPNPELPDDLIAYLRQRLATRYFRDLYPLLPKQVVHGAYGRESVLWLGDGLSAQGSGILTFEQTHIDTVLVDLAAGVGSIHPPVLRATVAAYSAVRPLTAEERDALPEALLLDAVRRLDRHIMYLHDLEEIGVQARALQGLVRNLDVLRQAVAPRGA